MHNLKTIKIHSFKAHLAGLDRLAEATAELVAGETLDGRLDTATRLVSLVNEIQRLKKDLQAVHDRVNIKPTPAKSFVLTGISVNPEA